MDSSQPGRSAKEERERRKLAERRLRDATRAFEDDQPALARRRLQGLRGTAESFGARQLASVLREVEKLCDGQGGERLAQFMEILAQVAARTSSMLAQEIRAL